MIMPADDPREAIVSKNGDAMRLVLNSRTTPASQSLGHPSLDKEGSQKESSPGLRRGGIPAGRDDGVVRRSALDDMAWITGRAGMEYRDLIPDRLGGRAIASHIRIPEGGEVPDYVHYHKVRFQMIYCKSGSIGVVYENQGPPFVMNAGDCVLQPPEIRHRVLEASAGAEVIEVSSPAEHETWVEHEIELPTSTEKRARSFNGQRFVHHDFDKSAWLRVNDAQSAMDTGIGHASGGIGDVRILRFAADDTLAILPEGVTFLFMLNGKLTLEGSDETFGRDRSVVFDDGIGAGLQVEPETDVLLVRLLGT